MDTFNKTIPTPGPWRVDNTDPKRPVVLGPIAKVPGAVVGWEWVAETFGVNGRKEANATLVAAAPDMLEACRFALDQLCAPDCPVIPGMGADIKGRLANAIRKATGGVQ